MTCISELPPDALLHLCQELTACDVAVLGSTCRYLRSCTKQESVWKGQCEAWLEGQGSTAAGPGLLAPVAWLPAALLDRLALPSFRALYTALSRLGSWPEGLWYATSEHMLPRGELLVVRLHPQAGLQLLRPRAARTLGPPPVPAEAWELQDRMSIRAAPSQDGSQATWRVSSKGGVYCSVQLSLDAQRLSVHSSSVPPQAAPPSPGCRTLGPEPGQAPGGTSLAASVTASLAAHLGLGAQRIQLAAMEYRRVLQPLPGFLQAVEGEPPGMAMLRRCQGVFFGSYGPHGLEVLNFTASSSDEDVPPECPVSGPRLQALKLVGDPNVPALKHSFVVDAASCRQGPYNPAQDDPFAPAGGPARPCLSFWPGAAQVVDLEERPVAARFRAVGCINVVPGVWEPEWVPATCLLYHPPMERTLSVVFEDEDQPFRHCIDYQEFPFGSPAAPSAAQDTH